MANRVDSPNRWPERRSAKSGAFGTGSWMDTSPRFGCCLETKVAIRELAENVAANNFFAPVVRSHQPLVPIGELVDSAGPRFAPARLLFNQKQEVSNA
jgi:hypothetical protein